MQKEVPRGEWAPFRGFVAVSRGPAEPRSGSGSGSGAPAAPAERRGVGGGSGTAAAKPPLRSGMRFGLHTAGRRKHISTTWASITLGGDALVSAYRTIFALRAPSALGE